MPADPQETQKSTQVQQSQNGVAPTHVETSSSHSMPAAPPIDTSTVKLRDKSKRGRATPPSKVSYVVPRFDDFEEDSVKVSFITVVKFYYRGFITVYSGLVLFFSSFTNVLSPVSFQQRLLIIFQHMLGS